MTKDRNSNVERKSNDENANDEMETARAMLPGRGLPFVIRISFDGAAVLIVK